MEFSPFQGEYVPPRDVFEVVLLRFTPCLSSSWHFFLFFYISSFYTYIFIPFHYLHYCFPFSRLSLVLFKGWFFLRWYQDWQECESTLIFFAKCMLVVGQWSWLAYLYFISKGSWGSWVSFPIFICPHRGKCMPIWGKVRSWSHPDTLWLSHL